MNPNEDSGPPPLRGNPLPVRLESPASRLAKISFFSWLFRQMTIMFQESRKSL